MKKGNSHCLGIVREGEKKKTSIFHNSWNVGRQERQAKTKSDGARKFGIALCREVCIINEW